MKKIAHPVADSPTRIEVRYITSGDLENLESLFNQGQSPLGYSQTIDPRQRYHATDSLIYTVLKDWEKPDPAIQQHKHDIILFLRRLPQQELLFSFQKFLYVEDLGPKTLQLSVKLDVHDITKGLVTYLADHGDPDLTNHYISSEIPTYVENGQEWYSQHCYSPKNAEDNLRQCIWFGTRHPRVLAMDLNELEPSKDRRGEMGKRIVSKDQPTIDSLIYAASTLLDHQGHWLDKQEGRQVYDALQKMDRNAVGDGLARQVRFPEYRSQLLILGVKLGIPGSETKLNQVLIDHGDDSMAEDFLKSGFPNIDAGVREWARSKGYQITLGSARSRAEWGDF
ncbi:MAG: hypothetical protein R3351_01050 [Nitrospirales bacterium]|nr:hypothetical protein [Nitrospirales bacterium]